VDPHHERSHDDHDCSSHMAHDLRVQLQQFHQSSENAYCDGHCQQTVENSSQLFLYCESQHRSPERTTATEWLSSCCLAQQRSTFWLLLVSAKAQSYGLSSEDVNTAHIHANDRRPGIELVSSIDFRNGLISQTSSEVRAGSCL
jgi:hypothetical protein